MHGWRYHYSWVEAPSCDANLLLHYIGLRKRGTFQSMISMLENAQLSGCTLSKFSLWKHFSLQTEPVSIFPKFRAVPKERSMCLISGWAPALCFASALPRNIIYPHYFLTHSCHAGNANFLQFVPQRCTMHTTTILCVFFKESVHLRAHINANIRLNIWLS